MYDWDNERREQIKRVKNICYYPPSLLKKRSHRKGSRIRRRGAATDSVNEPNKQLYDMYQMSLRASGGMDEVDGSSEPEHNARNVMSSATDARNHSQRPNPLASVNESTEMKVGTLPEVPQSTKHQSDEKNTYGQMKAGYQTTSGMYEKGGTKPPLRMAKNSQRLATGNALVGKRESSRTQ